MCQCVLMTCLECFKCSMQRYMTSYSWSNYLWFSEVEERLGFFYVLIHDKKIIEMLEFAKESPITHDIF